uniref:Testis expressed 264, ER-phagy receptor n=1 Tax=Urocitellus parryii TaxID=9999 RepID=A0A8D2IB60_UROPR
MSDLLLLGLIGGLTLLLLLTLLAFAGYSGLLTRVAVSAGSPLIRNITVAYKFHVGPYGNTGQLFTESCSISPELRSIAVYYDHPHMVPPEKCRCAVGSILSEGEVSPSPELIQLYQKFGFKIFSFPAPSHVVTATFPYTTSLSIWLATRRVHPALDTYIKRVWDSFLGEEEGILKKELGLQRTTLPFSRAFRYGEVNCFLTYIGILRL